MLPPEAAGMSNSEQAGRPVRVVIAGGGFGGMACGQALGGAPVEITVVDRNIYPLFVPLLSQVATAALSPADITQPIRRLLKHQPGTRVLRTEITGVDTAARTVHLATGRALPY